MLWGLPPETWLELWSGAIGAFVSAIAAALVAWGVVSATNKHQSTLSDKALREQRKQARRSLQAQQDLDRDNAARQAMARYISNALELVSLAESRTPDELRSIGVRLQVAATEIRILGNEFNKMGDVLLRMSRSIRGLAARELASRDGKVPEFNERMRHELNLIVSEASALIPVWWNEEPDDQDHTISRFESAIDRANNILELVNKAATNSDK
ncbi:hypothetical protein [Glutamicibacter mishrai]|uniref:hypothetical protein n=1 Tax=Glutamicibacter mishrai TaxID=1775880 RepID=UPI003F7A67C3